MHASRAPCVHTFACATAHPRTHARTLSLFDARALTRAHSDPLMRELTRARSPPLMRARTHTRTLSPPQRAACDTSATWVWQAHASAQFGASCRQLHRHCVRPTTDRYAELGDRGCVCARNNGKTFMIWRCFCECAQLLVGTHPATHTIIEAHTTNHLNGTHPTHAHSLARGRARRARGQATPHVKPVPDEPQAPRFCVSPLAPNSTLFSPFPLVFYAPFFVCPFAPFLWYFFFFWLSLAPTSGLTFYSLTLLSVICARARATLSLFLTGVLVFTLCEPGLLSLSLETH